MPSIPPTIAKDVFSVINCRSSRHRVAPSAARSVISRSRAVPRISSKFATLKQPVTKRRTAAATNRVSTGLTSPTIASLNGMVTLRTSRGEPFGAIGPSCRTRVPDSSATWATVALACTRATRLNQPSFSVSGAMSSGRQTSASPGNVNPCGATPATVAGRPLSRSVRPTTAVSPPNSRRQKPYAMTATGSAPATASCSRSNLPTAGRTPSTSKKFPDTAVLVIVIARSPSCAGTGQAPSY